MFWPFKSHYQGAAELQTHIYKDTILLSGPGSSVGIATELRAGASGIESRWGQDFPPVQTDPGANPASCTMGTGPFPGVEADGRGADPHRHLVPRS